MKALSIIGIILSLIGIMISLFVMTSAKCHCYCNEDYLYSSGSVPDEAIFGSLISLLLFVFFMISSIVSAAKSFGTKNNPAPQPIPPYQPMPYPNYPPQQFQQQYPPNPYQQNPYQQNPYNPNFQNPIQNPTNAPQDNPWAPPKQGPPTEPPAQ